MTVDVVGLGAAELARRIRHGDLTPVEVVDEFIDRIERVNPSINAMVTPRFEAARAEAKRAAESLVLRKPTPPPLFGVPITVKDAFAVAGVRFTAGAMSHRNRVPSTDAEPVCRLRAAGAIVLGKTNCPDLSASAETQNLIFGLTRNPWNPRHSAGGSTGGEAALIAAGGSPLGLGSDIVGSIRLPAAFCGVFGFKPSPTGLSQDGLLPHTPPTLSEWCVSGPLARSVEDLALTLRILLGKPVELPSLGLGGRTKALVPAPLPTQPASREVSQAIRRAIDVLSQEGFLVSEGLKLPLLAVAFEYAATMEREWLRPLLRELGDGKPVSIGSELVANWLGRGRVSTSVLAALISIRFHGRILRWAGYGARGRLAALRTRILAAMGTSGVLLLPVFPKTAPRHGFVWMPAGSPTYTSIFNALGFPACAIPAGLSDTGLPLSVQIAGRPGQDGIVLGVSAILEKAFGPMPLAQPGSPSLEGVVA